MSNICAFHVLKFAAFLCLTLIVTEYIEFLNAGPPKQLPQMRWMNDERHDSTVLSEIVMFQYFHDHQLMI